MKTRFLLLVATFALIATNSAQAGVISSFLGGLGTHFDHHNDSSFEDLIDNDGNGLVSVGDVFEGVFLIESVGVQGGTLGVNRLDTTSATLELTGYFRTKVLSKTAVADINPILPGDQGGFVFTFGPDAGSAFTTTYGAGTMAVLFEDITPNFSATTGSVAGSIATATDGVLQAVVGFTGLPGEGWASLASTDDPSLLPAGASTFGNNYQANLNYVGTDGDYYGLNIQFLQPSAFPPGGFTQFSVNGQFFGGGGTDFPVGGSTDIFFTMAPVPEPASMLVWSGLSVVGFGLVAARKRRLAAKTA